MSDRNDGKGFSLAKGPVAIVGLVLLAYGVTGLLFGAHNFGANFPNGSVDGKTWLGLEGNGWTNVLIVAAGLLLLFGSPLHWGAKTLALVAGTVLLAVAVIAFVDGHDAVGLFAANRKMEVALAIAGAVLLVLALLPRVGGRRDRDRAPAGRRVEHRVVERHVVPESELDREPVPVARRSGGAVARDPEARS